MGYVDYDYAMFPGMLGMLACKLLAYITCFSFLQEGVFFFTFLF